jgi:hypothetical protein
MARKFKVPKHYRALPKKYKKEPEYQFERTPFDRHPNTVDDYSAWTDRSQPTPELDKDPRTAFDALDPDKPRGM